MPLYIYRCTSCDHVFEDLVSATDARAGVAVACPECGKGDTERQLTTFSVGSEAPRQSDVPFCGRCGENRPPCGA